MKTIEDSNRLIAEFDGFSYYTTTKKGLIYLQKTTKITNGYSKYSKPITSFKYHQDWNKLMLIVDKIERMDLKFSYLNNNITSRDIYVYEFMTYASIFWNNENKFLTSSGSNKINVLHDAVVKFIEYYNEHSKS